jgi:hypothetical protein
MPAAAVAMLVVLAAVGWGFAKWRCRHMAGEPKLKAQQKKG